MLEIDVAQTELWDPIAERFLSVNAVTLVLEHSLVSVSKWEAKWHKSFFSSDGLTSEETLDYVRCMTVNRNIDPLVYRCLSDENIGRIKAYIDDPHTATWFSESKDDGGKKRAMTSELLYFYMFGYGIPIECEKWHLNRLITLIRVCYEETKPKKKKSKAELAAHHRAVNAARRKKSKK